METFKNKKLKKKLESKGITLDKKKKHQFNNYNYYQVINAYKNIFSVGIEDIYDIKKNISKNLETERYRKTFEVDKTVKPENLLRNILIKICRKYGILIKYSDTNDELIEKIKGIKYYNHLYSDKVLYSDFIRIYKFEHELRNLLLKYSLIIEENLKNIFVSYLNDTREAKDTFLTDINQYETGFQKTPYAIKSIKKVFDKQTNKYSNPIKRKNDQDISCPYWIIINELTLRETINIIINLKGVHSRNILERCLNHFTKMDLKYKENFTKAQEEYYFNRINTMREILNLIGIFRNNLAHNQPIYGFNVREYYSTKTKEINYLFPNEKKKNDQYALNAKYMSYLANFFGSDRYNSRTQYVDINLSWIIYVIYKIISTIDKNNNFHNELTYTYSKYNILLRPNNISLNNFELYNKLFEQIKGFCSLDFEINEIIEKIDQKKPHKKLVISLNKKIDDVKTEMESVIRKNNLNGECAKYNPFLFEKEYSKYTGINKKFFDKIK